MIPSAAVADPAGTDARLRQWGALALLMAAAIAFGFLRGTHFENVAMGVGHADSYWTQFWLTNYQDGFVRRSLLGSLLVLVVPPGTGVGLLSALHLAVSGTLLATGMVMVMRAVSGAVSGEAAEGVEVEGRAGLACAALFGFSPIGPMLFETTGDPLQVAMLAWLGAVWAGSRLPDAARIAVLGIACIVAILIHEAAAFFVLPHLLRTLPGMRALPAGWRTVLAAAIVAGVAVAIALLASDSAGLPRFYLTNSVDGSRITASVTATPGFAEVFRKEMHDSFGSLDAVARFIARLLRFALVPLAIVAFMATFAPRRIVLVALYGMWVACAVPLYGIAHDWGRFGVLTLFVVLAADLAEGGRLSAGRIGEGVVAGWNRLVVRLLRSPGDVRVARILLVLVIVSSSVIWKDYRVAGGRPGLLLALPALLLAAAVWRARGRESARQA